MSKPIRFIPAYRDFTERDYQRYDKTPNGVIFYDELAGPDGAYFTLISKNNTPNELQIAARYLYSQRDVVGGIYLFEL